MEFVNDICVELFDVMHVSVVTYTHLFVEFVSHLHVEFVTEICVELFDVMYVFVITYTHLF